VYTAAPAGAWDVSVSGISLDGFSSVFSASPWPPQERGRGRGEAARGPASSSPAYSLYIYILQQPQSIGSINSGNLRRAGFSPMRLAASQDCW
jgi:hypothetical protein